ncbi:DUF485 domain-containing protein [Streptomyces sp. NPDC058964]|uniref:DUF485 domain-containing protein n=1 Tax=Streptomyces sp. NPDC058964 TaxID=3346681 RepID=UPI0036CC8018
MSDASPSPEPQQRHPFPLYGPAFHSSSTHHVDFRQPQAEPGRGTPSRRPTVGHHSDLRLLRSAYRSQRRVATFTALGYFTLFLVLSALAPSLMTGAVSGGLSTGLLLGLLQVPVTCLSIALFAHTARRRVDPIAERIRKQAELDVERGARR